MKCSRFLFASILIVFSSAACGTDDAGPNPGAADAADTSGCLPEVSTSDSGEHNPGLNCTSSGCHDGVSANAPQWTVAGTLYTDASGSAPRPGGRIVIVDAAKKEVVLTAAQNGNFYTQEALVFPLKVRGSACPSDVAMASPVAESGGSCNQGGCHSEGKRIYVTKQF